MNLKISVIVPVYMTEKYLFRCIESLRSQTYDNIEIICVNDGSTDRSGLLLEMFARLDDRIVVIDQENKGIPGARNTGLDAATGQIVMFVDSDDALEPDACQTVVDQFLGNGPLDALVFGTNFIGRGVEEWMTDVLTTRDVTYDSFTPDVLFKENLRPFVWHEAFDLEFLRSNGIRFDEDVKFGEDQVFQFVAFPRTRKTVFISDRLYDYRCARKDSLMAQNAATREQRVKKHMSITDRVCQHWTESGDIDMWPEQLFLWTISFLAYDVLSMGPADQARYCNQIRDLWAKWFPPYIAQNCRMNKYELERYKWISGVWSESERKTIARKIEKNELGIGYLGQGLVGEIKAQVREPLFKLRLAARKVLPFTAEKTAAKFEEVYDFIDHLDDVELENSMDSLLLLLELEKKTRG